MSSLLSFTVVALLSALHTTIGDSSTDSVSLTPLNPSSSIASISLVENGDYHTTTNDNKYECNEGKHNSFCVYLNVYNTGCNGIETLSVTVNGEVGTNVDLFALFSVKNRWNDNNIDYFSFFSDWSGSVADIVGGQTGGVFMTPDCGNNLLLQTNNIDTLLDESTSPWTMRQYIAGDNTDIWDLLTSKTQRIGSDATSVSYTIINDPFNNQITAYFDASISTNDFIPVSCVFNNQIFDRSNGGNDYLIAFAIDQDIIQFSQFDVEITCDNPTTKPSSLPTNEPTMIPTGMPTSICNGNYNYDDTSVLYEWYNSMKYDHFYTTNTDEAESMLNINYEYLRNAGYLFDNEIVGVTVPLFRYYYACGTSGNHYYTTNYDEIGSGNDFYTLEGIEGYIMTQYCDGINQPLYKYTSISLVDSFYTINFNELGYGNDVYEYDGIIGYIALE